MLVNVNGIYYVHVCEQTHSALSVGNSAIENLFIIITRVCVCVCMRMCACMRMCMHLCKI